MLPKIYLKLQQSNRIFSNQLSRTIVCSILPLGYNNLLKYNLTEKKLCCIRRCYFSKQKFSCSSFAF